MKLKLPKITYNSPVVISFALISLGALILGIITGNGSTGLLFSAGCSCTHLADLFAGCV